MKTMLKTVIENPRIADELIARLRTVARQVSMEYGLPVGEDRAALREQIVQWLSALEDEVEEQR